MRETFSDFCRNKDNQLVEFYETICQDFEKKQEIEKQKLEEQQQREQHSKELESGNQGGKERTGVEAGTIEK